ncbi:Uncharacterised protein [Chlamydia trachomatis]|nr:Uncharacterised protein [Chlamydia trachomatis]
MLGRGLENRVVVPGDEGLMFGGERTGDDRPDGMEDEARGQVVGGRHRDRASG